MPVEIERKFLVKTDHPEFLKALEENHAKIEQGYISSSPEAVVRVRRFNDTGYLTVKGPKTGIAGAEYEYCIPVDQAQEMLTTLCRTRLMKERRYIPLSDGLKIELDYFPQIDLHMAEIELPSADHQVQLPPWIGKEVSHDPEYFNNRIAERISAASEPVAATPAAPKPGMWAQMQAWFSSCPLLPRSK